MEPHDYRIYYVNIDLRHQYGMFVAESPDVPPASKTSSAARSEEKRLFSQATVLPTGCLLPVNVYNPVVLYLGLDYLFLIISVEFL